MFPSSLLRVGCVQLLHVLTVISLFRSLVFRVHHAFAFFDFALRIKRTSTTSLRDVRKSTAEKRKKEGKKSRGRKR